MSTIAGFNDGAGSFGSAFGQICMGMIQRSFGWQDTMAVLSGLLFLAALPSFGYLVREFRERKREAK